MKTSRFRLEQARVTRATGAAWRSVAAVACLLAISCGADDRVQAAVADVIHPAPLGDWRWEGHLGAYVDTIARARILGDAWTRFYPETEEAFRLREDDKDYPKRGVWRGEFWGKYILSAIDAQRYYSDEGLKGRIAEAVRGLLSAQEPNGYLGTYSHSDFVGRGTWNVWSRKYTLWGLLAAAELLDDETAVKAAARFIDHLMTEVGPKGVSIVETGFFEGLPSSSILGPVVALHRATGRPEYLDYAHSIVDAWSSRPGLPPDALRKGLDGKPVHEWFEEPAAHQWAKSYEFMSCIEGMVHLYRVTGDKKLLEAAETIHRQLADHERSSVGSVSFNDKFVGSTRLINIVAEICDAVYWNRLSFELFRFTKNPRYLDEIERTLYNALLCGGKPDGTWGLRRLRLTHEHVPAHYHFLPNHQCCVDNLPRGLFQGAESSVFVDSDGLYLALFEPAAGRVQIPGGPAVALALQGDFLEGEEVAVSVNPDQPAEFTLRIRNPYWSARTQVSVNGEAVPDDGAATAWVSVRRTWAKGDRVSIRFDCPVRFEFFDPGADEKLIEWSIKEWAALGLVHEDPVTKKKTQIKTVTPEDALPNRRAFIAMKGPLALARDVRLAPVDVTAAFANAPAELPASALRRRPSPDGIWKAWQLTLPSGQTIDVCDFASAGNTWDERSRFAAWCLCD